MALVGVEPAGRGVDTPWHGAVVGHGADGILHGAFPRVLEDADGQIQESHSISAGLDYPGVGPQHAHLAESGRVDYQTCLDRDAVDAYLALARTEGIIPALESAHALAVARQFATERPTANLLVCLSGRGDKDLATVHAWLEAAP